MHNSNGLQSVGVDCSKCPLRGREHFRDFSENQLAFVRKFKTGELNVEAGATILVEGAHSAHLFTVLSGWAYRHMALDDGRRQILNFALPGDLVGLQGSLMGEMQHSIETLTPVTLCVFERRRLEELFSHHPSLAYDITWIAAREERILDENLLSIGRRSAIERAAYLLAFLHRRASATGAFSGNRQVIPVTQQQVADTLGLSVVHTNKTLRKLAERGLIRWLERGCEVRDAARLAAVAGWQMHVARDRPFV